MRGLIGRAHPSQRIALTVAAVFILVGLAWVILTDILLYRVIEDKVLIARFETAKGWAFVCLAGLLLYVVALLSAQRLARVLRLTAAVVESIGDGVLLLGRDRTIAHANPAAVRMLRCELKELIGMDAAEFSRRFRVAYPNGALVPPEKYISQRAFDEAGPLHYKAALYRAGDTELVFAASAAPVRMKVDEPARWVVSVMHDITDTENMQRLRDKFFAAAAHSLKTPVAIIKANAQALLPAIAPQHQSMAASMERQCDRMDRLVQNLLVLARARSGTLELHPFDMNLRPLVEKIAREPVWSYRHFVQADVKDSLPIFADQERLGLVIRNFMHEACRLSPPDSPVTLQAGLDGERVAIGIRYRPLPWHEYASDVYDEYDDIGIGRSVAATIVEAHGGSLSNAATGSEVNIWIHLPSPSGAAP